MSKIMFHSWTYKRNIPSPFENFKNKKRTDIVSKYCSTRTKMSNVHGQTLAAIIEYINVEKGIALESAIGMQNDNYIISEYRSRRHEVHLSVFNKNNGKFICSVIDGTDYSPKVYEYETKAQSGTALFFTLMPLALEDKEFKNCYDVLYNFIGTGVSIPPDTVVNAAYIICDNLYRRIENAKNLGSNGINVEDSLDNIALLSDANIEREIYSPNKVIAGNFNHLKVKVTKTKAKKSTVNNADFIDSYKFNERTFSPEEKELIPKLEDWYVRPYEVDNICKHAKETVSIYVIN